MMQSHEMTIKIIPLVMLFFVVASSLPHALAVNVTAINDIQSDLAGETTFADSFPAFWFVFLLIILGVFMVAFLKMREDRETVFFSLGALVVSIMLTLLLTSPLAFDYQTNENKIVVEEVEWEGGTITYNSGVSNVSKQVILIPANSEFRMALSLLFTGLTLFNGLYSIYILVNYHEGKKLNPDR